MLVVSILSKDKTPFPPFSGKRANLSKEQRSDLFDSPLSNSLSGIKTFMKAVIDARPWLKDPLAVRKRWSDDEYALADHGLGKNLCFAILVHSPSMLLILMSDENLVG